MRAISKCLNMPAKVYGLKIGGAIGGVLFGLVGLSIVSMLGGIAFSAVGYVIGCILGDSWHEGSMQASIYWHLPSLSKRRMPESHLRYFM